MTILIGLDPGMTEGATVAINEDGQPLSHYAWGKCSIGQGLVEASNAARKMWKDYPEARLCYESAHYQYFTKRVGNEKELAEIVDKLRTGRPIHLPGGYSTTSTTLNQCIGVFLAFFPRNATSFSPQEWRRRVDICAPKGSDWKALAIAKCRAILPDGRLRAAICSGNDHLAESYLIAFAGCGKKFTMPVD